MVMVLIAAVGIGALTVVLLQNKQTASRIDIKLGADADTQRILSTIEGVLSIPSSCNANFYHKNTSGSITTSIMKCTGNCSNSLTPSTAVLNVTLDFSTNSSVFPGEKVAKARISSITYALQSPQTHTVANHVPAVIKITVDIEKNLGNVTTNSNTIKMTTSHKQYFFYANVITGVYTPPTGPFVDYSPVIQGCSRNSTSTYAY